MEENILTSQSTRDLKFKYNSDRHQVIINSSASLFRNISGYKFNAVTDKAEKEAILNLVAEAKSRVSILGKFNFYNLRDVPRLQRQLLIDQKVISYGTTKKIGGKAVILNSSLVDKNKLTAITVNEDEHLKIECIMPGRNISNCYREVLKVERGLEKKLSFAFSQSLGYLTSNPSLIGTGLKASIIAHVPCLVISTRIVEFIKNLNQTGFGVSSFFGEGTEIIGNLFQISNLVTLGKNEDSIIEELTAISKNVIEEEEAAKKELKSAENFSIEDSVYRSFGMIKYAKILSFEESLELLSILKFGLELGIIDEIKKFDFYELINIISDSNIEISYIKDKKATLDEIDFIRACVVREKILKDYA
jgi:protein arginine kinase